MPKYTERWGFSASLPPSHQTLPQPLASWVGRVAPGSAGACANARHNPLIPSLSHKRKVSVPLHAAFETWTSNYWPLTKWNLLLTSPGKETYSDRHLLGSSLHLVKAMAKLVGGKLSLTHTGFRSGPFADFLPSICWQEVTFLTASSNSSTRTHQSPRHQVP